MGGPPLVQAKKATAACLAALDATDRFGLVAFDDSVEVFRKELSEVSKASRADAVKFLDSIEAKVGTELGQGLKSAGEVLSCRKGADTV
jgi:Ca-activated chloride channel family protein